VTGSLPAFGMAIPAHCGRRLQGWSAEAQLIRTTPQARRQIVATLLQIQGFTASRVGEIHRSRSTSACASLLGEMPLLGGDGLRAGPNKRWTLDLVPLSLILRQISDSLTPQ
jgi:hypothetical protein